MKKTQPHNWSYVLWYTLGSIAFLGLIVLVAEIFFPSTTPELIPRREDLSAKFISTPAAETRSGPFEEKITLPIDHEKIIGGAKIVYRGLAGNSKFKIDVVILDLDPHAYYGYRLTINDARKGFRLAGNQFKLVSVRKTAIQIRHIK
jgi:hypothetical protein